VDSKLTEEDGEADVAKEYYTEKEMEDIDQFIQKFSQPNIIRSEQ